MADGGGVGGTAAALQDGDAFGTTAGVGTAMKKEQLFIVAYCLLGLVLLGIFAYMFDQVHPERNKGKAGGGPLAWWAFVWSMGIFPFVYLAHGLEAKDWKAIGIFLVAFVLLAVLLAMGIWRGNVA